MDNRVKKAIEAGQPFLQKSFEYALGVESGEILACRYVKLAVKRFYSDLDNAHERGWAFSADMACYVFGFIYTHCKHYQGEWAGQPIKLDPWQCFIVANVFGWVSIETGARRFRNVYEEVARKNGKTTKLGGIGTYLVSGDFEPGAKVYCAATKREQAREVFDSIAQMVKRDGVLRQKLTPQRNTILCETTNSPASRIELLSKDYNSMDGFNVHGALIDEIHAHPDSGIWDVLESGRGARRQPIIWGITTAGKNHKSFCYEMREYSIKILEGTIPADQCDSSFAIIYTLDEDDDWTDPAVWIKSNPNLGVSVDVDDMINQCQKAKEMPTARVEFQTKRLNIWVYGDSAWMNMEKWNECLVPSIKEQEYWTPDTKTDLDNHVCYGGLDLASSEDLTAFTLDFRMPNGQHRFISRGYIPELAFDNRMKKGGHLKSLYQKFRDLGELIVTPGTVCDYEFVKADIKQACKRFNVKEIAFDRWNSSQLVTDLLEDEIPMVSMGQGFASVNAPMKEMLRLALSGNVQHNNSLLTFAMSNVVAVSDPAGNIKFDKSKVSEKIDPAAATIMALGRSMVLDGEAARAEAIDDFLRNPISI